MSLPPRVGSYKVSPQFTLRSVPRGLLMDQRPKAGTWGIIQVHSGTLSYFLACETQPLGTARAQQSWAVPPEVPQFAELSEDGGVARGLSPMIRPPVIPWSTCGLV